MFADDTNLFFSGKHILKLQGEANTALKKLQEWFNANRLTLNVEKTCFSIFTNSKSKNDVKLYLNQNEITRVYVTKYLGMYLDESLSWTQHVEYVINKIVQLKGAFYYLSNILNKECYNQIYYAYVFPYIKYGIEVYGACNTTLMNRLQREQNKIIKTLYHKDRQYSTDQLYSELKLLKCSDIHKLFVGIFVYKHQNDMLPGIFNDYYNLNSVISIRLTRQSNDLHIPLCRTKGGQRSIKYIGAKLWNELDNEVKSCPKLNMFKDSYRRLLIDLYEHHNV